MNIAHRDLKFENLLMDENFHVKIGDFGCAVKYNQENKILENDIYGTWGYMAPEKCRYENYDPEKADVFSLGVILFALMYGFSPIF